MKTTSFAVAAIAAVLLPCLVARGQFIEFSDERHSLSEWIEKTKDPKPEVRKQAALALRIWGLMRKQPCRLTRMLGDKEREARELAAQALGDNRT